MRLSDVLSLLDGDQPIGKAERATDILGEVIQRVVCDARQARRGDLFVALPGSRVDGHQFLGQAALGGATAALVSRTWAQQFGQTAPLPCLPVADTRVAMALVAGALFDRPSETLKLVGVTGTNGKTTTTSLLRTLLVNLGVRAGLVGTLGAEFEGHQIVTGFTTPQSPELQKVLRQLVNEGAQAVVMEVSSHAIDQARVYDCEFDVAIFTNLSRDHLDYHGSMAAYGAVKRRLFSQEATGHRPRASVINVDDALGQACANLVTSGLLTYGLATGSEADLRAEVLESSASGSVFVAHFRGQSGKVHLPLPGRFNVYNALAAVGAALAMGYEFSTVCDMVAKSAGVPGRVEVVSSAHHPFTVWVDYAHTPDGLHNVLSAARELGPRRLVTVFGCGGDRDRTKRPLMGEVVEHWSDVAIVTSDNPRSEDPMAIINEIGLGMRGQQLVVVDRAEAIKKAIELAQSGDLIVIAGKGHETTQTFADRTVHFDDRDIARHALHQLDKLSV